MTNHKVFTPSVTETIVASYGTALYTTHIPEGDGTPDIRIENISGGSIEFQLLDVLSFDTLAVLDEQGIVRPAKVVRSVERARHASIGPGTIGGHRLQSGESVVLEGVGATAAFITLHHHSIGAAKVTVQRGTVSRAITD